MIHDGYNVLEYKDLHLFVIFFQDSNFWHKMVAKFTVNVMFNQKYVFTAK